MLRDMECIYTVYLEKSFSKAAKKLYISQPALSAKIKKVESTLKITIFDRSSNPIKLTTAGKYYIKSIEKIMEIQRDMASYFAAIAKEKEGTINVGSSAFFCAHILPSIVDEFQEQHPNYNVNILEMTAEEATKCLKSDVINLCIGVEALEEKLFNRHFLCEEEILLAVPSSYVINDQLKDQRLTFEEIQSGVFMNGDQPAIKLSVFKNEPFILLRKGNDLYARGMKFCQHAGFKPNVSLFLDQLLTSYYVAYGGKGVAFVRASIVSYVEPTEKMFFYKIDDENAVRKIMLHYKKTSKELGITGDLIDFIIDDFKGKSSLLYRG